MVLFVKIDKNGNIQNKNIDIISNLYKKCGFRKSENFQKCFTYNNFEIWGKNCGKNNKQNTYDIFVNKNIKIYGDAAVIKINKEILEDLSLDDWNHTHNKIINNDSSNSNIPKIDVNYINKYDCISDDSEIDIIYSENSDSSDNDSNNNEDNDKSISSELKEEDYIYSSE